MQLCMDTDTQIEKQVPEPKYTSCTKSINVKNECTRELSSKAGSGSRVIRSDERGLEDPPFLSLSPAPGFVLLKPRHYKCQKMKK